MTGFARFQPESKTSNVLEAYREIIFLPSPIAAMPLSARKVDWDPTSDVTATLRQAGSSVPIQMVYVRLQSRISNSFLQEMQF